MIIIVGSNKDDTLYFESKLKNKKEYLIFKKYKVLVGTILNRPVCILSDVYSDYLTSILVSYLIEKFHGILVFSVGKCRAYDKNIPIGKIVVSKQIYLGDIDEIGVDKTTLGQIPSLPEFFLPQQYTISIVRDALAKIASDYKAAIFVSINSYEKESRDFTQICSNGTIFGHLNSVVIDSETGGCAVAAHLYDIPCVAIKVVEGHVDEKVAEEHLFDYYAKYPIIGKIITYCIGEIGRNDMLDED